MKNEPIWTEHAIYCLESIILFISQDSEFYAKEFAKQIVEQAEKIPAFPEAGRIVPEYNDPTIREIIYHNYRIVYRLKDDAVNLVYIGHASKLLPDVTIH